MEPRTGRHPHFFVTDILVAIAAGLTLLVLPYQAGTAAAATEEFHLMAFPFILQGLSQSEGFPNRILNPWARWYNG